MPEPISLLFESGVLTSSLGFSFQSAATLINGYYGRKLEYERMDRTFKMEADRISAMIKSKKEELEHAQVMFEKTRNKELEIQKLEFEYQKMLADHSAKLDLEKFDLKVKYEKFPLDYPLVFVNRSYQDLLIIVRNEKIPSIGEKSKDYSKRVQRLKRNLQDFITDTFKQGSNVFLLGDNDWKDPEKYTGSKAVNGLYACLKDRFTLYVEYEIFDETKFRLNTVLWGPHSAEPTTSKFAEFDIENYEPEDVIKKIELLRAIVAGGFIDIHGMLKNSDHPKLPLSFPKFAEYNDPDITKAMKSVLLSYITILCQLEYLYPQTAKAINAKLIADLKSISDTEFLDFFMDKKIAIDLMANNKATAGEKEKNPSAEVSPNIDEDKDSPDWKNSSDIFAKWKRQNQK